MTNDKLEMDNRFCNECFIEYKKLGGKKDITSYRINLSVFLDQTLEIWVYGDPSKHNSREKSMYAVSKIANISMKEVNLILESIDKLSSYTWLEKKTNGSICQNPHLMMTRN